MKSKPRILILCHYYCPAYNAGGPVVSLGNLAEQIGDSYSFRVITGDRDAGDPGPFSSVLSGQWQSVGRAQVRYLAPEEQTLAVIARLLRNTPHDVLYLNSFFDPRFTNLALLARRLGLAPATPLIIAPRGEFSAGALALKAFKKRAFMRIASVLGLHRRALWHASNSHETVDIKAAIGRVAKIHEATDLPAPIADSPPAHRTRMSIDPLRVIFLSRVSPKKNLAFVMEVLNHAKVPVTLSVFGPISEPNYWYSCLELARQLPQQIVVRYRGTVRPDQVAGVFADHDLFFLPTLGENFGHVIIESLGAGTPVLISDRTPWRGLSDEAVGWDLSLNAIQPFVQVIEGLASEESEFSFARRLRCHSFALRFSQDDAGLANNRALFDRALRGRFG